MTTYVPASYVTLIKLMSGATGVPYQVIACQAAAESGFNDAALSPAGAEGWLQFLPSTFYAYWHGSPYNRADAANAWILYMRHLLNVFHGSVRWALAGYNAGEGNPGAGLGYADGILACAGQGTAIKADQTVKVSSLGPPAPPGGASSDDWSDRVRHAAAWLSDGAKNNYNLGRAIRRM
jgi:soluble lytic murein transglycosylase-like protein